MDWPQVTFGGSHEPYIDRVADEMAYLTRPKTVAAYGTVQGYPWSLVLFSKQSDPEDDEPMMPGYKAKPGRCEFFLGGSPGLPGSLPGGLGGGGGEIRFRAGGHIHTNAHSWATNPPVIGYAIFTSDDVTSIRVSPEDSETRVIDTQRPVEGFPKFCVFFPPFAVAGSIEALNAAGRVLHRRELYSGSISAGAAFGGGD